MKKKFFAMYALAGALVASPVFTSCVDDTVSPQVEALRDANIKYKNAQTAQMEAQTAINQANAALNQEAQRIANAHNAAVNAYNEALNALTLAQRQYEAAQAEANRALQEEIAAINTQTQLEKAKNALEQAKRDEEQAKINLEQQKIYLESQKRQEAEAAAKAELELEKALVEAEKNLLMQKQGLITQQNLLNKALAELDEKVKGEAQLLNKNAQAIMVGGTFTKSDETTINYNSNDYSAGSYNSIITLKNAIAKENVNIIKYEAKLIDVEAYVKEQTAINNKKIAVAQATIDTYKELQAAGSYDAVKAKYDEAKKNVSTLTNEEAAAKTAKQEAKEAFNAYIAAEDAKLGTEEANAVYAYIAEQLAEGTSVEYMTKSTKSSTETPTLSADTYEFSTSDATDLDGDITDAEGEVTDAEDDIQTRKDDIEQTKKNVAEDIVDLERDIVIEKAALKALQDAQAALKAEAGYATHIATLTDAVTTAKTEFETTPSQANKTALEKAEAALAAADKNYPATPGAKTIADYEELLKEDGGTDTNRNPIEDENGDPIGYEAYVANMEAELALLKALTEDVDFELYWMSEQTPVVTVTLEDLEAALVEKQEALAELEALKEMLAEESEAMVAYNKWVEGLEEKIEAYDDNAYDDTDLTAWEGLVTSLESYVTKADQNGNVNNGSLDYAGLIEAQETIITNAKAAIAQLGYKNENGGDIEMTYDDMIKLTEAEIAAMEAELEIRQAEYDAIMKQLDALVEAETETEGAE